MSYFRFVAPPLLALALFLAPAGASAAQPATLDLLPVPEIRGILIAAPHGGFDLHTERMARQIAWLCGGGYVLASGFRTHEHPLNVNRPTEGVGLLSEREPRTAAAVAVYDRFAAAVDRQHPGLYVEIHGNGREASAGALEVATQGLTAADAGWLREDFGHRLEGLPPGMPRLRILIEPLDTLHFAAAGVKITGVFRLVPRALHIEIPRAVRDDATTRSRYASMLALSILHFHSR